MVKLRKKLVGFLLTLLMIFMNTGAVFAVQEAGVKPQKPIVYNKNARSIKYAFVFDGPSDKNDAVLKQFKSTITRSTAPDYKAEFPSNLVFVGNWTKEGVKNASDKAINSDRKSVV